MAVEQVSPGAKREELFRAIHRAYNGEFQFYDGFRIDLCEGANPVYIWILKYTGKDLCKWCPAGVNPIIQKWKAKYNSSPYHSIDVKEGWGNYYLLIEGTA